MRADPGIGRDGAPIGSVEWAQRVRLSLQSVIQDLPKAPERVKRYFDLIQEHRAWTLMNKPDGSFFATFDEFCSHKQPWGLGKPYDEIRPFLEAAVGKRTLELVTVAPDARAFNGAAQSRGDDGRFGGDPETPHDAENRSRARKPTAERLRAILRAPEAVQDLYRRGLIGQREAARLGPKNPTPEQAARVVEVAREARKLAESDRATAPKVVQRKVNARVRELTVSRTGGAPGPSNPAVTSGGIEDVWSALVALPRADQETIRRRLERLLSEAAS